MCYLHVNNTITLYRTHGTALHCTGSVTLFVCIVRNTVAGLLCSQVGRHLIMVLRIELWCHTFHHAIVHLTMVFCTCSQRDAVDL